MRRLLLIDDRKLLRELLTTHLAATGEFEVVDAVGTAEAGWKCLKSGGVDLAVCELDLPDECGLELLERCRERQLSARLVFLTECWSEALLEQALRLGAAGYLLKQDDFQTTRENLGRCADGLCVFSDPLLDRLNRDAESGQYQLRQPHTLFGLNDRQVRILRHLVRGQRVQDIASQVGLTASAVESHKFRLMRHLGINDRVELTRFALREGLLTF